MTMNDQVDEFLRSVPDGEWWVDERDIPDEVLRRWEKFLEYLLVLLGKQRERLSSPFLRRVTEWALSGAYTRILQKNLHPLPDPHSLLPKRLQRWSYHYWKRFFPERILRWLISPPRLRQTLHFTVYKDEKGVYHLGTGVSLSRQTLSLLLETFGDLLIQRFRSGNPIQEVPVGVVGQPVGEGVALLYSHPYHVVFLLELEEEQAKILRREEENHDGTKE